LVLGVGAVIALMLFAIQEWMQLWMPLALGLGGVTVPAVVLSLLASPELRESRGLLTAQIVVATLLGVLPGAWFLKDARIAALDVAVERRSLLRAMADPSKEVQLAACTSMLRNKAPVAELYEAVVSRPRIAEACLSGPEAQAFTLYPELTRQVTRQWHLNLRSPAVGDQARDEAMMCEYAGTLGRLDIDQDIKVARLTDCTLRGPTGPTRSCCGDALKAAAVDGLPKSISSAGMRIIDFQVAGALVKAAFEELTFTRELQALNRKLEMTTPEMQQVALEIACLEASEGAAGDDLYDALDWLFRANAECIEGQAIYEDEIAPMSSTCKEILGMIEDDGFEDEQICKAQRTTMDKRIAAFSREKRINRDELGRLSAQIKEGRAGQLEERLNFDLLHERLMNDPNSLGPEELLFLQRRTAQLGDEINMDQFSNTDNQGDLLKAYEEMVGRVDGNLDLRAEFEENNPEFRTAGEDAKKALAAIEKKNASTLKSTRSTVKSLRGKDGKLKTPKPSTTLRSVESGMSSSN